MEKIYLKNKKVKGGELGMPNFATMKPVLQISTKTAGMAMIHWFESLNFGSVKKVLSENSLNVLANNGQSFLQIVHHGPNR